MRIELKEHWTTKAAPSDAFDAAHTVAVNAFGFYCVPEIYKTREVCRILTAGDANEPRTVSIIRRFCGTGDVVSGGAFVGDLLPAIADGLADGARLHSFEPNPVSFAAARYTLALNALQNVALHKRGCGQGIGSFSATNQSQQRICAGWYVKNRSHAPQRADNGRACHAFG